MAYGVVWMGWNCTWRPQKKNPLGFINGIYDMGWDWLGWAGLGPGLGWAGEHISSSFFSQLTRLRLCIIEARRNGGKDFANCGIREKSKFEGGRGRGCKGVLLVKNL